MKENLVPIADERSVTFSSTGRELSYGDSIVYLNDEHPFVLPQRVPAGKGSFTATPQGLWIDPVSGVIDMNKSQTGMWFKVSFKNSLGVVAQTKIMISGIEYESGIYDLSQGQRFAVPYYNASKTNRLPDGEYDARGVSNQGAIDLLNYLSTGQKQEVSVKYRLDDPSKKALNKIDVRIYHFSNFSEVPDSLKAKLKPISTLRIEEDAFARDPTNRPPMIIIIGG